MCKRDPALGRPRLANANRFLIPMYIGTALITPPLRGEAVLARAGRRPWRIGGADAIWLVAKVLKRRKNAGFSTAGWWMGGIAPGLRRPPATRRPPPAAAGKLRTSSG